MSEQYDTFNIMSHEDRASIPSNGLAKICAGGERFWVYILENDRGSYRGRVDSPVMMGHLHGLSYRDEVSFEAKHVFDAIPAGATCATGGPWG